MNGWSSGVAALFVAACHRPDAPAEPDPTPLPPVELTVAVQASDLFDNPLHYQWRATDGDIVDVDAPSTAWTLPPVRGWHYAYVLVRNDRGGYTERRVAVSTDDLGADPIAGPPIDIEVPAAPPPSGVPYTSGIRSGSYGISDYSAEEGVYLPDVPLYLEDIVTHQRSATVHTDARGRYTIDDVPPGEYELWCSIAGGPYELCHDSEYVPVTIASEAANDSFGGDDEGREGFSGRMVLADGTPCGTINEFFGVEVTGAVELLDAGGQTLAAHRTNAWGHYGFAPNASAASIRLTCEEADPVTIIADDRVTPRTRLTDSAAPVVSAMTASLADGTLLGELDPPASGPGSSYIADPEFFLAAKGIDTRSGACQYYLAIGAVQSCSPEGAPSGALTLDDWLRQAGMGSHVRAGGTEVTAMYVNHVDTNAVRDQHSIAYGPDDVAAYVCNLAGPVDDSQPAIDEAIAAARAGRNRLNCAAMDFRVFPGVNGDQPFARFLLFGPGGELSMSTNSDGRREKFVPGACVACHGSDRYAGRFPPEPGVGHADVGGHFLPYDAASFWFSTDVGATKAELQAAIHQLNVNVLSTRPTPAAQELIEGWYAGGGDEQDEDYLPIGWRGRPAVEIAFYQQVWAPSCRTCHVVLKEILNLDHPSNLFLTDPTTGGAALSRTNLSVCGGSSSWNRSYSMPNSQRTMDLFWASAGTANDQPALVDAFWASALGLPDVNDPCALRREPVD